MSTPREEAARWFIRMHRDAGARPGAADAAAWRRWMDADPRHAAEYAAFEALWQDFDSTPRTEALATAVDTAARQRRDTRSNARRAIITRGVLGVAGLGTAGLLAWRGWLEWQDTTVFALARDSAIGERIVLNLPDASVLTLGPASRIATRYAPPARRGAGAGRGPVRRGQGCRPPLHHRRRPGPHHRAGHALHRQPPAGTGAGERGAWNGAFGGERCRRSTVLAAAGGRSGELPDESAGAAPVPHPEPMAPTPAPPRRVQRDARDSSRPSNAASSSSTAPGWARSRPRCRAGAASPCVRPSPTARAGRTSRPPARRCGELPGRAAAHRRRARAGARRRHLAGPAQHGAGKIRKN